MILNGKRLSVFFVAAFLIFSVSQYAFAQGDAVDFKVELISECPSVKDPNEYPPDDPDKMNRCGYRMTPPFFDGTTQRVDWNAGVFLELEASNPILSGDLLIYELNTYIGNVRYVGKAVDNHPTLGQTYIFDRNKDDVDVNDSLDQLLGELHYSISKDRIVFMDFELPLGNTPNPEPYRISYFSQDDDILIDSLRMYVAFPNDWLFSDDLYHFKGKAVPMCPEGNKTHSGSFAGPCNDDVVVEFIDEVPNYNDNSFDSENYFLRQNEDYKNLDIYYRLLVPENTSVEDVKINIYGEYDETAPPIKTLKGNNENGVFQTGELLKVSWEDVREGMDDNKQFREYGFYRLELEVKLDDRDEPIKTPIEDGDLDLPGWQCPQKGLGIHDLVYKHRPLIHVSGGEDVIPDGPVHPFNDALIPHYSLLSYRPNGESSRGEVVTARGKFTASTKLTDLYRELESDRLRPNLILHLDMDDDDGRAVPNGTASHVFHRGHTEVSDNFVFIQYWMFEPSSHSPFGFLPRNNFWHEGDWEMVQLAIKKNDLISTEAKSSWMLPFAATASQHFYGQTLAWRIGHSGASNPERGQRYVQTTDDGNRVLIFIAENAHATYFTDGDYETALNQRCGTVIQYRDVNESLDNFDRIQGARLIENYGLIPLENRNGEGVFDWPGRWGDRLAPHMLIFPKEAPPSPFMRRSEGGPVFIMNDSPDLFHNCYRKRIDNEGNANENGNQDELTDLGSDTPAETFVAFQSHQRPIDKVHANEFEWVAHGDFSTAVMGIAAASSGEDEHFAGGYFADTLRIDGISISGHNYMVGYIAKFDSKGDATWIRTLESSGHLYVMDIASDEEGNVIVGGSYNGAFINGGASIPSKGLGDVFLAKYNSVGELDWIQFGGGAGDDYVEGVDINQEGVVVATGSFFEEAEFGSALLTSSGSDDIFVAQYSAEGDLKWIRSAGGSEYDYAFNVTIDSRGNSYLTGSFEGTASFENQELISAGNTDAFLSKYDSEGLVNWTIAIGGDQDDHASGIAIGSEGAIYLSGAFQGTATFELIDITAEGDDDAFVAKYEPEGTMQWVQAFGGDGVDKARDLILDSRDEVWVTGTFSEVMDIGDTTLTSLGDRDVFIARYSSDGIFGRAIGSGGEHADRGFGIASNNHDEIIVTGTFENVAQFGNISLESGGYYTDFFLGKLSSAITIGNETGEVLLGGAKFNLSSIYPNPFRDRVTLNLSVPKTQEVKVLIFDMLGRQVHEQPLGVLHPNTSYKIKLELQDLPSGLYLFEVKGATFIERRNGILLR